MIYYQKNRNNIGPNIRVFIVDLTEAGSLELCVVMSHMICCYLDFYYTSVEFMLFIF